MAVGFVEKALQLCYFPRRDKNSLTYLVPRYRLCKDTNIRRKKDGDSERNQEASCRIATPMPLSSVTTRSVGSSIPSTEETSTDTTVPHIIINCRPHLRLFRARDPRSHITLRPRRPAYRRLLQQKHLHHGLPPLSSLSPRNLSRTPHLNPILVPQQPHRHHGPLPRW